MSALTPGFLNSRWRMMPNRVPVTFRQQTAPGVYTDIAVSDAWYRRFGTMEAAPSKAVYVRADRNWFIPKQLLTLEPQPGDIVRRESIDYTVLAVFEAGAQSVWQLGCVNLKIAAGLKDSITILRPTNTKDGSGNRVPSFAAAYTGIDGKLQEIDGGRDDAFGHTGFNRRYAVYLAQRVTVTTEDQVQVGSTLYQITGYRNPDRIDELMTLDVEKLP